MKKVNEFTYKEMKDLLDHMIDIREVLLSHGYKVPVSGSMYCPFHDNDDTPAAKYYQESNSIYCFSDHILYRAVDVLSLVGEDYKEVFKNLWNTYSEAEREERINKIDKAQYESKLLFIEPLTKFKMGLISYPDLCDAIAEKLISHRPILQMLYNISRPIDKAYVTSDDYTHLACFTGLDSIRQITSGEIVQHQPQMIGYKYILNFIEEHQDVLLIFNMCKDIPISCTIRSKSSHAFIDVGNSGGLFYGLFTMNRNFKYGDPIVLVEGPKDCETYRKVFNDKNCLAMMTSNTTITQLEVLKYLTNSIILANDNDTPGIKAQKEFIKWNKKDFKINVLTHPTEIKDFGDLIPFIREDREKLKEVVSRYKIQIRNFL